MNELHAKILNRCREKVAENSGVECKTWCNECTAFDWSVCQTKTQHNDDLSIEKEAALLAMQEQAEFFEDIIHRVNDGLLYYSPWIGNGNDYRKDYLTLVDEKEIRFTIMELFEQWERERG